MVELLSAVKAPMLKIRQLQMTPVQVPTNYALGTNRARISPVSLTDLITVFLLHCMSPPQRPFGKSLSRSLVAR